MESSLRCASSSACQDFGRLTQVVVLRTRTSPIDSLATVVTGPLPVTRMPVRPYFAPHMMILMLPTIAEEGNGILSLSAHSLMQKGPHCPINPIKRAQAL